VEAETNRREGAHEIWQQYPKIQIVGEAVADWLQSKGSDRMTEILNAVPQIDVVYGHNDPMAIGAYLAAKDKGREKEMIFVGVDGLDGPGGGVEKVNDGILAATFVYPLCVDQAVDLGNKIMRDPTFKPEKSYTVDSRMVTPAR
jgi:ribose transport system substrate-binding protein